MTKQGLFLLNIINENKLKNIAEVGVWKGKTERFILKQNPSTLIDYWAIDKFDLLDETHGHMHNLTKEDWDEMYYRICRDMYWFPQLKVLRLSSEKASKMFPDNYFDIVFIDASHFYDDVLQDVKLWFPKVKVNGFLTGHDYGTRRHPQCKLAIDYFFKNREFKVDKHSSVWVYQKQEHDR